MRRQLSLRHDSWNVSLLVAIEPFREVRGGVKQEGKRFLPFRFISLLSWGSRPFRY